MKTPLCLSSLTYSFALEAELCGIFTIKQVEELFIVDLDICTFDDELDILITLAYLLKETIDRSRD
jgi:hypothetical protein